ncbi:MAG: DarT ssDNA thymidine ADP-ribosyltransferase family protein [Bacteroidales bacterium]|nr:DarT ssDNA thymidine ADP-ribosyltransferase family protein [Bacteroidales bacterium]
MDKQKKRQGFNLKIPDKYKGKYFFHFTHIENLESIVKNGLLSTNKKKELGLKHTNVASETIQHRRSEMDVTCSPNGKVHDYVPFYFTSTNPMLLSLINHKNIDQPFIIFIAVSVEIIIEDNVVFTDASANTTDPPNFYNNPNDLDKLDWDAINKKKWGSSSDGERHKRMAEVLIFEQVPFDRIDSIIVWNESFRKETVKIFKDNNLSIPNVTYQPFNGKYFYFCKFFLSNGHNETLVTGPYFLKYHFTETIKTIIEKKNKNDNDNFLFENIADALDKIEVDFCVIKELNDIYELETKNEVHSENVSDHTKNVVENLEMNKYYTNLTDADKNIIKLSAYLHDIGKGPKSKWKDGIQIVYPDHPADAIPMLERMLTEDFEELSEYEIRKICLLVAYHDLVGDVLESGRSRKELIDLDIDENELNMLIAICLADISAINSGWYSMIVMKLPKFVKDIKQEIK